MTAAPSEPSAKKGRKKKPVAEQEPDMDGFAFFTRPKQVNKSEMAGRIVNSVFAGSNYCYALVEDENELYAWGFGSNYVLGTREEDNVHEPLRVHPKQFHENRVKIVGTGSQHVVVVTTASTDPNSKLPALQVAQFKP